MFNIRKFDGELKLEVAKAGLLALPYISVFPCVVLQDRHRICIKFYIGNNRTM
jgi:hypothetical protein